MLERRLALGPYLIAWAAVCAVQVLAFAQFMDTVPVLGIGIAALLQVLKVPIAAMRCNDLGAPPDDAALALVPLMNLGLWWQLKQGTPTSEAREKRRARWSGERLAIGSIGLGFRGLLANAGVVFPVVAVLALADAWGLEAVVGWLSGLQAKPAAEQLVTGQIAFFALALLGLYTVVQFFRRAKVSRGSWLPSLLLIPLGFLWAAIVMGAQPVSMDTQTSMFGGGAVIVVLTYTGWTVLWLCIAGATLGILSVSVAEAQRDDTRLALGPTVQRMVRRTADVSAVHGAASLIIQLGMQVVIPGIHYAIHYAFVDVIAVLDPQVRALRRSTDVGRPIRRRIFKIYLVGFFVSAVLGMASGALVESLLGVDSFGGAFARISQMAVVPPQMAGISPWTYAVVAWFRELGMAATGVAFAHLYWERSARAAASSAAQEG